MQGNLAQRCTVGWSLLHLRTPILLGQGIFGLKVAKPKKPREPVKEGMKIGATHLCGDWWVKRRWAGTSKTHSDNGPWGKVLETGPLILLKAAKTGGGNGYLLEACGTSWSSWRVQIILQLIWILGNFLQNDYTLLKTNMTTENALFEDVFPIENGGFSDVMSVFTGLCKVQPTV